MSWCVVDCLDPVNTTDVPFTYIQSNTSSDKWIYSADSTDFVMLLDNKELRASLGKSDAY